MPPTARARPLTQAGIGVARARSLLPPDTRLEFAPLAPRLRSRSPDHRRRSVAVGILPASGREIREPLHVASFSRDRKLKPYFLKLPPDARLRRGNGFGALYQRRHASGASPLAFRWR